MKSRYELITYSHDDSEILSNTILSKEDKDLINNLVSKLANRAFSPAIEALYKFHKNNYSTSDIAEIYNVSTRQIQNIFKEMGINRDKFEAQQIAAAKHDSTKARKLYISTALESLTCNQLNGSMIENVIRHQLNLILNDSLPDCEIIVGINSINTSIEETNIPVIIIRNSYLYKYIIEIEGTVPGGVESKKKKDKNKNSKLYYKGYTLFQISVKAYLKSKDDPELKYEREIRDNISEIVRCIVTEVYDNRSTSVLE